MNSGVEPTAIAPLLALQQVDGYYGAAHILSEISLAVQEGETVLLAGRNGAGKSTTIKAVMGMVRVGRGRIRFSGHDITELATHHIARLGLGYVPEERRIFTRLTVRENLMAGRRVRAGGAWTVERLFDLFDNLAAAADRAAGMLSGGEQQMLTIARTLMGNPSCILLDEPSEGLAPIVVERISVIIKEIKQTGIAILLSEQNVPFAASIADRVYVLESGRVGYQGTMLEFLADTEVRERMLAV